MQHESAKPKGEARSEDAPRQEPMRGSASIIRRNPSTDQKKVRRQMAKKADFDDLFSMSKISVKTNCIDCNETMIAPEDNFFPECPNCRDRKRHDVAADQDKSFFDQTKASRKTASDGYDEDDEDYEDEHEPSDHRYPNNCPDCGTRGGYNKPGEICPECDSANLDQMGLCPDCNRHRTSWEKEHMLLHDPEGDPFDRMDGTGYIPRHHETNLMRGQANKI